VDSGLFSGNALTQIAAIRDHELAHADAIASTLSSLGAPVPPPTQLTFPPDANSSPARFLGLAAMLKPVEIGAYHGVAGALQSQDLLAACKN
jgi:hypothetical protein